MVKYDLTNFFQSAKKPQQNSEAKDKNAVSGWKFESPSGEAQTPEIKLEEQIIAAIQTPAPEEKPGEQKNAAAEVIEEALKEKSEASAAQELENAQVAAESVQKVEMEIKEIPEVKKQPILGLPTSPSVQELFPRKVIASKSATIQISNPQKEIAPVDEQRQTVAANGAQKDGYIAKTMHELIMANGWAPTKTTPENDYYFYSYLPPEHKRSWMQARVYISKLNLNKTLRIEGLTIPPGMEERLIIIIRMQKSGGIDRLANSKTITQTLDTNNYFNQNAELVNPEGLRAVLSSYLKQAEIL